jgi:hypothetical protein
MLIKLCATKYSILNLVIILIVSSPLSPLNYLILAVTIIAIAIYYEFLPLASPSFLSQFNLCGHLIRDVAIVTIVI